MVLPKRMFTCVRCGRQISLGSKVPTDQKAEAEWVGWVRTTEGWICYEHKLALAEAKRA